jgi:para-aminobenzoate synthetase/4-amino-4-deoxychorismate lyase
VPLVLVQDEGGFLAFQRPAEVLEARVAGSVVLALERADEAIARGRFVAGYLAYEAAAAFGLPTRQPDPDGPPLLWLGVFDAPARACLRAPRPGPAPGPAAAWAPALDAGRYETALLRLQARIAAGDTYRVNFTFPLSAELREEPPALFARLFAAQRPRHAAFVDLGRFAIASASPELFFEREGERVRARPMKGTAAGGPTAAEDASSAAALRGSEKERAENLMIVDMLRNDLGRVAELGSVEVASLFEVERYPTLLQMTSTVAARSRAPLSRLLAALFPCASVTGPPKRRTMELIAEAEHAPRGVYTGAIGWAGGGRARFNVAIRTAVADRQRRSLAFGVGSAIVVDSTAAREHAECLLKARILDEQPFALLETMALLPGEGFRHLADHLVRLFASARHFGYPCDGRAIERALRQAAAEARGARRVRLLLHGDGVVSTVVSGLPPRPSRPLRVGLALRPLDPRRVWLGHKTTRREPYEEAAASRPDCDDVLLWNERGELTESSVANVVFELGGVRVTPPESCGLLPGVARARALAEGRAIEGVVRISDLRAGMRLWLLSSLRGSREAVLVE